MSKFIVTLIRLVSALEEIRIIVELGWIKWEAQISLEIEVFLLLQEMELQLS
jgi:hypothetical protein